MQIDDIVYLLQFLSREISELSRFPPVWDNVLLKFLSSNLMADLIAASITLHILAPKQYRRLDEGSTCFLLEAML